MTCTRQSRPDLAFAVTVLRQAHGMSKSGLARVIGVDRQWIQHIERGSKEPKIDSVYKLAAGLGVSAYGLIYFSQSLGPIIGISVSNRRAA